MQLIWDMEIRQRLSWVTVNEPKLNCHDMDLYKCGFWIMVT